MAGARQWLRRFTAVAATLALGGCGADHAASLASAARRASFAGRPFLSVPALGTFSGRCDSSGAVPIRYAVAGRTATESVTVRIGRRSSTRFVVDPGHGVVVSVPLTRHHADVLHPATERVTWRIRQATEPYTLSAVVLMRVSQEAGETTSCILVGTRLSATEHSRQR